MDERLEQLWATHEIRQLALDYALAADTRDWALMRSLWVATPAPLPFPFLDIHIMQAEAAARFEHVGATCHTVCNHRIDLTAADRATGSVYSLCFEDHGRFVEQAILYQDRYERHDGKWLFLHRKHLLWWGRETSNPMLQPPANWPASQVGAGIAFDEIRHA